MSGEVEAYLFRPLRLATRQAEHMYVLTRLADLTCMLKTVATVLPDEVEQCAMMVQG